MFYSGLLSDIPESESNFKKRRSTIDSCHKLVNERYFDPDLWQEVGYLANLQKVLVPEEVARYNNPDFLMTLQILTCLKKEAPWIYKELDCSPVADVYFDEAKGKFIN